MYRDGVGSFGLYSGDGPIVALDPKNGHLLWQRNPLPPGASLVSPLLQPTVQDGLVYVPASYRDASRASYHAALEALDPVTGQLRWRHEVAPQQDGKTLWKLSTTTKLSVCTASAGIFYLTESNRSNTAGGMLALNSQTGQQLWHTATNSKPPALVSGVAAPPQRDGLAALYLPGPCTGTGCTTDTIAIVQMRTGNILWQKDIHGLREIAVTIVGDHVVVPEYALASSASAPVLVGYSLPTGSRTWSYTLGHA